MNLSVIKSLANTYDLPIGLSDHSRNIIAVASSVCYGAVLIEVHFTFDLSQPGPDHHISLLPEELSQLVDFVDLFERTMGNGERTAGQHRESMRETFTNGVVAKRRIEKGSIIRRDDLCLRKPNRGIGVDRINDVIGASALTDIEPGEYIYEDQFRLS